MDRSLVTSKRAKNFVLRIIIRYCSNFYCPLICSSLYYRKKLLLDVIYQTENEKLIAQNCLSKTALERVPL